MRDYVGMEAFRGEDLQNSEPSGVLRIIWRYVLHIDRICEVLEVVVIPVLQQHLDRVEFGQRRCIRGG